MRFIRVKKAIDDTSARLLKEEEDELIHKDFYVENVNTNRLETAKNNREKTKFQAKTEEANEDNEKDKKIEVQLTAQLSNLHNDLHQKLSHTNRSQNLMKLLYATDAAVCLDAAIKYTHILKYDVGEPKDLLNNYKEEANHV